MSKAILVQQCEFPEALARELELKDTTINLTFFDDGVLMISNEFCDPTQKTNALIELPLQDFIDSLKTFVENINNTQGDDGYNWE